MASTMASAAAHSIPPPYAIAVGPRVRPPRLLPGTKAANTNPQPEGPPPEKNQVWVQGKWRNINSNATKDQRVVASRQTEKALKHSTHGMYIYAYTHIRTNQVVYSLSRVMDNNKIIPQLVYHGKKTVPAALRRDTWRPYFSLHFAGTPAGARAGLKAYQHLRELAMWRQLSPPPEFLIATEKDVEKAKTKYSPSMLRSKQKNRELKNVPIEGQRLPKELRAIKLMNQKASSVADAAYVLGFLNEGRSPAATLEDLDRVRAERLKNLSKRATNRLSSIREKELAKSTQLESRQQLIRPDEGQLGLTRHAAERIAMEHAGVIVGDNMVTELQAISEAKESTTNYLALRNTRETTDRQLPDGAPSSDTAPVPEKAEEEKDDDSRVVAIMWTDIRDAAYAKQWSSNVYHGELEPRAIVKKQHTITRQEAIVDEDGQEISEQKQKVLVQNSTTPHVFGRAEGSGWYEKPEDLDARIRKGRQTKVEQWQRTKLQQSKKILTEIDALQVKQEALLKRKQELEPEYSALQASEAAESRRGELTEEMRAVQQLTEKEKEEVRRSMATTDRRLAANEIRLAEKQEDYSLLFAKATELNAWRQGRERYMELLKARQDLQRIEEVDASASVETKAILERIDALLATYADLYPELEGIENTEADLAMRTERSNGEIGKLQQRLDILRSQAESDNKSPENDALILEAADDIASQKRLISTDHYQVQENRETQIQRILEAWSETHGETTDLLLQRIHAERSGDAEQIASINAELDQLEEREIQKLLGLDALDSSTANEGASKTAAADADDQADELDRSLREKGVELPPPPPSSENRGIWGRVKGFFGR